MRRSWFRTTRKWPPRELIAESIEHGRQRSSTDIDPLQPPVPEHSYVASINKITRKGWTTAF